MQILLIIILLLLTTNVSIIFWYHRKTQSSGLGKTITGDKDLQLLGNLFWNIFNTSELAILLLKDYKIVNCNKMAIKLFGGNADEIIGKTPFELSPEIQPDGSVSTIKGKEFFDKVLFDGVAHFEWLHQKINGELFLAQVLASSFETNGLYYAAATISDITKLRQEEQELQSYRLKLEQLVNEKTVNIEEANQELQALNEELDASNEELSSINEELSTTNEELEQSNNALSKELEEHKKTQAEKDIIEEKLNQFISQSSEAIILINDKGAVEDWNNTMAQITGITKENALGKMVWDVTFMMAYDPDKAEFIRESFKNNTLRFFEEVKQGNRKVQISESQIRHHDSSHRYIHTTLFPIVTDYGQYGGVIISDITQKKAIEVQLETYRNELEKLLEQRTERLEQLSVRFNEVYTNSSDAITFMDVLDEGKTIKVFDMNSVSKRLFKISDEQLVSGVYIDELLPEIKIESFKQHILPELLSGMPVTFTDDRDTGNGYWNSTVYPIKDAAGKVYRIAVFSKNVTAEYEREKMSAILQSAIDSWPFEFWICNNERICVLQNKASQRIWGDQIGGKVAELDIPGDVKQISVANELKVLQGEPSSTEFTFETPEGLRYVLINLNPIVDKNEITGFLGVTIDITEQKKAEIALKESEKRLNQLLSSITDYKFTVEFADGKPIRTVHSEGCLAVTGYSPADFQNNPYLWFEMVHDDDKQLLKEWSEKVDKGIEVESFEHRIIHKNGEIIWISNTTVLKK
ncbi:MAG TPA: PAS domain S-box protein, partial [Bacteroidales bacterium]